LDLVFTSECHTGLVKAFQQLRAMRTTRLLTPAQVVRGAISKEIV